MSAEPQPEALDDEAVIFFDGWSSRKRRVALRFGATLEIVQNGATLASWPYDDIRRIDSPIFALRRETAAGELARLELHDPRLHDEIIARCPFLSGKTRPGANRAIVYWSLAATTSFVALIWFGIPFAADRIAPLVPYSFERRIGEAAEAQLRSIFSAEPCGGAKGAGALTRLSERLQSAAALEEPARIEVLRSAIPNALALPGGKIYVFSGLLTRAETPDEVAGVVAHEIGHLKHRDSMRKLITTGGTSYLIGLLFGDMTGAGALVFASKALIGAAHSREAEAQADSFAADLMARLGRPAKPLGNLLTRISGSENGAFGLLHDHPLTADRLAALAAADKGERGPPLLDAENWAALKAICKQEASETKDAITP
ncbi:metalloendopeptidase [Methylosinus sp. R-45379]|uniref:M48 family metallopeptidase n=1 Tax=unclassified Methylosinus TaxID=2624500 RepID=UPI000463E0C1|nr:MULTISPECIES: M48 family metallopeptidase [unclassified Methylosinus]OAI29965.1 metalloendopeptidase [Methylosinus sp. R-45379]TDX65532.1 peptidase M48-like protein [Methylosinus sp. sav-2]